MKVLIEIDPKQDAEPSTSLTEAFAETAAGDAGAFAGVPGQELPVEAEAEVDAEGTPAGPGPSPTQWDQFPADLLGARENGR